MNGMVVKETNDGSLLSSCVIVRLQSTMSGNCFYFLKSVVDDIAGKRLSSPQRWLRSRYRWNRDGEVLRTGKTECCFLYWDCVRNGSLRSVGRSLCSEQMSVCPVLRRCSCPGKRWTPRRSRMWIWLRGESSAQVKWNPEIGCRSLK